MRKGISAPFWALLLAAVSLWTTACSSGGSAQPAETITKFSANILVTMGESEISCQLYRKGTGDVSLTVKEPVQLAGMGFEWKDNRYAISYNGLRTETENPFLPASSFASAIVSVLDAAEAGNAQNEGEKDGFVFYTGECSSGAYQYGVNSYTGFIEQITLEDLGIKAVLSEHQKIEQPAG